ncbi:LURP-one-related family protein [Kitasatospora sp. CM 4170]|uniref:LURP-one-related/scramblase family protein n=1 Tax=Kitasatospora aburaviensis TaxID=67265 RepID=A0ABW1EZG6_9ACTN|nr:LURP-one-related family protein [Kitasatospora sp. CM 4170]WNM47037.1 LURP-one-related family protein [Kitasatospora sp. CM 4170]
MRYLVREKLFAIGDDYWIEDERGNKAFLVDGKVLRLRHTFELKDADGRVVAVVREKAFTVRDAMRIENADGDTVATVREKLFTPFRDKYRVELAGGGELEIHGDLIDKDYRIEDEHGAELARISRKWFRIRDSYGVEIADGADTALLLAVAACVDHLAEED